MSVPDLSHRQQGAPIYGTSAFEHRASMKRRFVSLFHHPDALTFALGVVIGLGVCLPLIGGTRVFLLDWSTGPHLAVATPSALGLNGGLTAGIGGTVAMALLSRVIGGAMTWLPILVFFPVAAVGAGRLAGRSKWSRLAAGTLYAVNPFVFNRLYVGHMPLLIGYALLPFATIAAIRSLSSSLSRWAVPALWWAGLTSLSPHFAWIYGVVILGVVTVAFFTKQHPFRRIVCWFAACVGAFVLMSAYLILPSSATNLPTQVGAVSLSLYRTTGDAHLGLFANVASLYGFWRTGPGPELPKNVVSGWPFIMLAILLIVTVGAWSVLRKATSNVEEKVEGDPLRDASASASEPSSIEASEHRDVTVGNSSQFNQRQLAILLLFVGVAGYLLALGNQGPTGGLFLWAYDHVPFFAVMREPQKFLMLLALAYAVFFGWGVERLSHVAISPKQIGTVATAVLIGVVLPLGYSANIFDGLAGQITKSPLPLAYQQANTLMGDGVGEILYLPWHIYMEYPFTNGRVIDNVAPTSFSRSVISGDDVEAGGVETQSTSPRSAYLQDLYARGTDLSDFGTLVAPLGVKYVVLAKAVDWASFSWLAKQKDLKLVFNDSSLEVWRNEAYGGVGERVAKLTSVSGLAGVLTLAKSNELGDGAVVARRTSLSASASALKSSTSSLVSATSHEVQQLSPVVYRIAPGKPGWVEVDTTYQRGWSLDGVSAIQSAEGTVLVHAGAGGGILRFTPWAMVRLGYIVSVGIFVIFALIIFIDRRRRTKCVVK
jgi:hypothetical protein